MEGAMSALPGERGRVMVIGAKLQQLSVICAVTALIAAPAAIAAATTKQARGAIFVHVITKATGRNLKSCAMVHDGQAALIVAAGTWYLHAVGGVGQGRCYNKRNDGAQHAACTAVRVPSGKTMSLKWFVPLSR